MLRAWLASQEAEYAPTSAEVIEEVWHQWVGAVSASR
ncbi:MAG: hypothetical protein ACYDC5_11655 [Candidatus Dormibacteria bacterium]